MTAILLRLVAGATLFAGLGLGLPINLAGVNSPSLTKDSGDGGAKSLREISKDPILIVGPEDLKSPDGGDRGIKISSKRLEHGLIEFVVRIDPDAVEMNELYKGRITATAHLSISSDTKQVAWIPLAAEKGKMETGFRFSVAEDLAKSSNVLVGTHLHEKNGKPTLGGGQMFLIALKGFLP